MTAHEKAWSDLQRTKAARARYTGGSLKVRLALAKAESEAEERFSDLDACAHIPAPRSVPPLGAPLPTCAKCGVVYLPDDSDDE
jgi:hypothetical protein